MKRIVNIVGGLCFITTSASAFTTQQFHNDNAEQALRGFQIQNASSISARSATSATPVKNELVQKRERSFSEATQQFNTRYHQYYHGIRVLDGEVTIHEAASKTRSLGSDKKVVGQVLENIELNPADIEKLNTPDKINKALADAKAGFNANGPDNNWKISNEESRLVLKNLNGKLQPVYEVVFYARAAHQAPVLFHAFLDPAQDNKVLKSWNDVRHFSDKGPGGNNKTNKYHYGESGVPFLDVLKQNGNGKCVLNDKVSKLLVVDMSARDPDSDTYYDYMSPYSYECNSEDRDSAQSNGAFSPADDAYFFGHIVMNVYQDWYNTKVLDLSKIPLRVHYRENSNESYDNAFWDPMTSTMNFGDGTAVENSSEADVLGKGSQSSSSEELGFYPLVSLDVTAHEMSHGFTSAHADLQYHDESGALNESFSDMAGLAAVAYLRENVPQLYQMIYHSSDMNWSFGSTIMKNPDPRAALRFMDRPARDGLSAECYQSVRGCAINYQELVDFVNENVPPAYRQSVIVHCASGVYNRFFYLLSKTPGWNVKKAFNLMLVSNRDGYWTENSTFEAAACQTLQAAKDLNYNLADIKKAFTGVGISTTSCS